ISRFGRDCSRRRTIASFSRRSYSRLPGTKIRGQPRLRSFSTTTEPKNPSPPLTTTCLLSQKPMDASSGVLIESASRCSIQRSRDGRLPLVPVAELGLQNLTAGADGFAAHRLQVRIHHDPYQLCECNFRLPGQFLPCLGGVGDQYVHLSGP